MSESNVTNITIVLSAWVVFWTWIFVFAGLYLLAEYRLFLRGYDTFFWVHKTPAELAIQAGKIKPRSSSHLGAPAPLDTSAAPQ